ncbi:uncharacterized protein [Miscanthus floridulus]|uniref:uncharacterized protein n=1 Tax=Miscanthus floridulus TaxID=154761 RepID=UPI0034585767
MAIPNYTYLKLKMPRPNGIITVSSTFSHAFECDREHYELATAVVNSSELLQLEESSSPAAPDCNKPTSSMAFHSLEETKANAGTTYQRCMQQCFADQIDSLDQLNQAERPKPTIAVYVDDIVVKMAQACDLIANLAATFVNLRRFNIKLNPKKCVFGVLKGKLLGYIVFECGIEANPEKITTISNMGPIRNVKGV